MQKGANLTATLMRKAVRDVNTELIDNHETIGRLLRAVL